jgi:hypothetical protein
MVLCWGGRVGGWAGGSSLIRVLKPKGVYVVISYGIPDNRLSYLENKDYNWSVTVKTVRT